MANVSILCAYQRRRKDIGRLCDFSDSPPSVLVDIPPDPELRRGFVPRGTMEYEAQNTSSVSEAATNTVRKLSVTHGQLHLEGCWPKDIDTGNIERRLRYRRKAEKEDGYLPAVKTMTTQAQVYLRQNNAVDIFEAYYAPHEPAATASSSTAAAAAAAAAASAAAASGSALRSDEAPLQVADMGGGDGGEGVVAIVPHGGTAAVGGVGGGATRDLTDAGAMGHRPGRAFAEGGRSSGFDDSFQVLTMLGDPLVGDCKTGRIPTTMNPRTVCSVAWQPVEGPHGRRLAVAYADLRNPHVTASSLQPGESLVSYIWDPTFSNAPDISLNPPSQLWCLGFNPKDLHVVGGGCRNGALCLFDSRRGGRPMMSTPLYPTGRGGHGADCVGSGGVRGLQWLQTSGPGQEILTINGSSLARIWDYRQLKEPLEVIHLAPDRSVDALSLSYDATTGPNRFVVGTSFGQVLTCNRQGTAVNRVHRGHHGAVYNVQCSPHIPKVFLSCGGWTARVWNEACEHPLVVTRYSETATVDAAWHPQHPGVFVTALQSGKIEVRNLLHRLCEPLVSYQVSNDNLHCLKLHPEGEKVAVGTATGKVYIGHLSRSLLDVTPYSLGGSSDYLAEKVWICCT